MLGSLKILKNHLQHNLGKYIVFKINSKKMQAELFVPSYLKNTHLYSLKTKVSGIKDGNKVMFEDTIFHPQGGGQPKDKGWIEVALQPN